MALAKDIGLPAQHLEGVLEAGLDEAGRGCLAGPVVAAAVILPEDFRHPELNDSKQLTHAKRMELREIIHAEALAYAVGVVSPQRIDEVNILNASYEAMWAAVCDLDTRPEHLLVDGNRFKHRPCDIPFACMVKGDGRFLNIAAASILAKTHRDELMAQLDIQFPGYGWSRNKGYPTAEHRAGLKAHGITPHHRRSFQLFEPPSLF